MFAGVCVDMLRKLFIVFVLFFSGASFSETLKVQGKINRMGAMSESIGYDHWLVLTEISELGSCRKASELGNLVLFRVKKELGEREIYSTALAAFSMDKKVELLVVSSSVDEQGSCYIAAISFTN
ncbi:MAG: hypothetical protein HRU08_00070 [Oleispira sp.]|nr:hypothetical protein [Oleispira sp.]